MCQRLRAAMKNEEWPQPGQVEVDETFITQKRSISRSLPVHLAT